MSAPQARRVIRTGGAVEALPGPVTITEARRLIRAETLDVVSLRDERGRPTGWVMLVDDAGYETRMIENPAGQFVILPLKALKPVNVEATALYLAQSRPGTTHQIVGDVVITLDEDFA